MSEVASRVKIRRPGLTDVRRKPKSLRRLEPAQAFLVLLRRRWKPQLVAVGPAPASIAHGGLHAYPRRQQVGASVHVADGSRNSLRSSRHRRRLPTGGSTPTQDANKLAHPFTSQMEAATRCGHPGTGVDCPRRASRLPKTPTSWRIRSRRRWKPQLVAVGPASASTAYGGLHARPRRQQVGASVHVADGSRNSLRSARHRRRFPTGVPTPTPRRQQDFGELSRAVGASIHVKYLRPRPASAPCAARTAPALPGS